MVRHLIALLVTAVATAGAVAAASQAKTSHDGWPNIDGVLWINKQDRNTTKHGTARNDELLGGHGNDRIYGRAGADVIWGDYKATDNNTWQRDRVYSGAGDDW